MTTAELYYFICKCLVMDDDPEARQLVEVEISSGNVPWEEFVWMGSSHFVLPALYPAFRRNGILPFLPRDLAEHLQTIYTINEDRNKKISEQSANLIRILKIEGIEPLFLKGAGYLLQNLYREPGERIMSDIDILVPVDVIEKAARILYSNGYFHPEEFKDDDFEKHHHLPGFEHKTEVAIVELHSAVFPGKYQKILPNAEIFSEKRKIHGSDAWVLSVNHQQVVNFVHDQLVDDDFKYKTMLIKGLFDFYLLSRLNPVGGKDYLIKGYNRSFNTYCSFVSSAFNHAKGISFTTNLSSERFKRQFDYLLNHPAVSGIYQILILYCIRIPAILKMLIMAPFSKHYKRYILKKAGSPASLKRYFKNLKQEF